MKSKSSLCACIMTYCAVASLGAAAGCGSGAGTKALIGSYEVMISSMGKSDPDVMTVSPGADGKLLLTFAAGVTTDVSGPNPDGLRGDFGDPSKLTLAAQPAHIDHSTGALTGTVTGGGSLLSSGSCDVLLHFAPASGAAQDYQVSGTKM